MYKRITTIGDKAFYDCNGLTTITIGNSVTSIGKYAFCACYYGLKDVYCYAENVPATETSAFNNTNIENATLHVPAASIEEYKATEPWSGFGTIVALTDEETSVKGVKSTQQDADGKYLKNGKLIIVKDGKKYDAAGKYYK